MTYPTRPSSNNPGRPGAVTLTGIDANGDPIEVLVSSGGSIATAPLASERDVGTENAHSVAVPEWTYTRFNPRAASTGSSVGAAGAAGATEVLISDVPVLLGGVIFESDSTASEEILLRDAAATGASAVAQSVGANVELGIKTTLGLTVCGTAAGVSAIIKWRVLGVNA